MPRIRDSRPGDVAVLEALQHRAIERFDEYREALERNPAVMAIPREWIEDGRVRVAVDHDDRPIGFALLVADHLEGLYVAPEASGDGVGRVLLEDAAAHARESGAWALHVTANQNARGFYERVGFVVTAELPTYFGVGVRMRREL